MCFRACLYSLKRRILISCLVSIERPGRVLQHIKVGFNRTKLDREICFQKFDAGILFFDVSEQLCCTRWAARDRVPISEKESLLLGPWRTTLQELSVFIFLFSFCCNYFLIFNSILAVSISLRVVLHIFIMFPKRRLNVFQCGLQYDTVRIRVILCLCGQYSLFLELMSEWQLSEIKIGNNEGVNKHPSPGESVNKNREIPANSEIFQIECNVLMFYFMDWNNFGYYLEEFSSILQKLCILFVIICWHSSIPYKQ